jgi:hypothetical protein
MKRILLYYPATNIPDGAWVRNSLLYTDKVSSIFPYDLRSDHVTDLTKLLYEEELYHPIYISNVLNSYYPQYENFENTFIETIESGAFKKIKTDSLLYYSENTSDYEMFKNKFTGKIVQYLSDKQLLEDRPWGEVAVEKNAAAIYLGMLADYLARINNENLIIPSTDEQEFEKLTYQIADNKVLTHRIQLDKCLPTLSPNVTIKDIVKFKNKRKQELQQFREVLDNIELEIKASGDDQERKLKMVKFAEKVQKEILEIKKLLGDSKLDFVLNGLSSLLDFKQKEVVGTISGLSIVGAGVITSLPLIGLGAGTVLLAGTLISSFRKINRLVAANSSSYIYYAQKVGILA